MKKITTWLALSAISLGLISCSGQKENEDEKARKGWSLVWEDDFDTSLDTASWLKTPKSKLPSFRYMSHHEGLYVLQEGNLVLRALANDADNDSMPFLTGGINRPAFNAGSINRIEVRARMNTVEDATPYLSLVPADKTKNISIDFMERYGLDEFVYQSVTSEYTTTQGMPDNPPSSVLVGVNPGQYHTYAVENYADSVVFYVDDIRTKKYPRILTDIPGQFPFYDHDFDLFIGVRLNKDTDPSVLPADLFIDWVRYYEPQQPVTSEK
ncbi:glycoside hydrolase family 16 protein [Proteiniphilum sp. UBA1028]|jgi:beta-glucanase (GH16 family)|uniref:glycoside hydrolase family 16 protein n=1 Tax=Proteiniphilum sp. UBA1028 TaxID=1947251 RepID=UPI000E95CB27|nr:family 16 glycosylhydrolase [Proteiniphilum sp. UBA1028]HBG57047.1 beta-glucanase [Porphyromonadaceae bacterium]